MLFRSSARATSVDGAGAGAHSDSILADGRQPATGAVHSGSEPACPKVSVTAPLYAASWSWCRGQAAALNNPSWTGQSYARASQVLAEVLQAALDTGLDVSSARDLSEVREIALRHFLRDASASRRG